MSCTVKCRCGKTTQQFKRLNAEDIKTFECPKCPRKTKAEMDADEAEQTAEKAPNSPMERVSKRKESPQKPE